MKKDEEELFFHYEDFQCYFTFQVTMYTQIKMKINLKNKNRSQ